MNGLSLEAARATEPCGDCFFFSPFDSWLPILDSVWSKRGDCFDPLIAETPRLVLLLLIDDIRLDRILFLLNLHNYCRTNINTTNEVIIVTTYCSFPTGLPDLDVVFLLLSFIFSLGFFGSFFSWLCKIERSRLTGLSLGLDANRFLLPRPFFAFFGGA